MRELILIVDDEPSQLRMAEFVIKDKLQYRTMTASGGQEAITMVLSGRLPLPDLILLDLVMPKVGGLDVIRAVKACYPQMPIIVLTQYGDHESASSAVHAGANDFLNKPVSIERLELSMRNAIAMQRMANHIEQMSRSVPAPSAAPTLNAQSWFLDEHGQVKKLKRLEKEAICYALEHSQWCMTRTARNLGIGRSTLYRKISDFGLENYISRANQTTRPMIYISSGERS